MSDFPSSSFANSQARGREWTVAAGVSLVVSLAVLAPFFKLGIASGHDVAFHMASWLDVAGQWKQGVLFPRWAEWANFGFGEPRFVFYPPLSWLFGALLGTIFPWQSVVVIFIVCTQTFAGLSAYSLTRRLTDSRFAALLGAACFVANPYALLIIYVRSDFAELLAIAFFPILLLATMRLTARFEHTEPPFFKKILLFSLGYSAIWLCNAPAAVIASYSVALLVLVAVLQQRSLRPAMKGAAGITLGFGLAAFYLIPAIYEQRWVNINGALAAGLAPAENFLYSHTSDADHDAFNHVASHLAVFLIFWAIVAATAAWRLESHKEKSHCDSCLFVSLASLATTASALMLPCTLIFWRFLPELRFIQFPWRWMSVLALCAIAFTVRSARGLLRWAWLVLALVAITVSAGYLVKKTWWDADDMPALQTAIQTGAGFEGTDEYDPIGDDRTDLPQKPSRAQFYSDQYGLLMGDIGQLRVEKWDAEHRVLMVGSDSDAKVAIRLLNYPAWRVMVNGSPVSAQHARGTGQMVLPVPAGRSTIRIDFTRTSDRTLGGWISIFTWSTSLSILFWKRSRKIPQLANT
jgi:uncharacterized membrane protein